jgi:hypothetical protein
MELNLAQAWNIEPKQDQEFLFFLLGKDSIFTAHCFAVVAWRTG